MDSMSGMLPGGMSLSGGGASGAIERQQLDALQRRASESSSANQGAEIGREFESLLLKQVVKALRSTVPDGGLGVSGAGSQMYDHFIEDALTSAMSDAGGVGLASLFDPVGSGNGPAGIRPMGDAERGINTDLLLQSRARLRDALSASDAGRERLQKGNDPLPARESDVVEGTASSPAAAPEPTWVERNTFTSGGIDDGSTPLSELLPPTEDAWLGRPDARSILETILSHPQPQDRR